MILTEFHSITHHSSRITYVGKFDVKVGWTQRSVEETRLSVTSKLHTNKCLVKPRRQRRTNTYLVLFLYHQINKCIFHGKIEVSSAEPRFQGKNKILVSSFRGKSKFWFLVFAIWVFYVCHYSCGQANAVSFFLAKEIFLSRNELQKWIQRTKICPKLPSRKKFRFFWEYGQILDSKSTYIESVHLLWRSQHALCRL